MLVYVSLGCMHYYNGIYCFVYVDFLIIVDQTLVFCWLCCLCIIIVFSWVLLLLVRFHHFNVSFFVACCDLGQTPTV